jgi:hypothetical protein
MIGILFEFAWSKNREQFKILIRQLSLLLQKRAGLVLFLVCVRIVTLIEFSQLTG